MHHSASRILIVAWAFYPGNSPRAHRATELAKELSRQGHSVTVLTLANEEQATLSDEYGIQFIDLGQPSLPEIPVGWKGKPNIVFRAVRRLLWKLVSYPEIELVWRVARRLPRDTHFDYVISIAVPHAIHWGVAWASARGRKPGDVWIADCGDPFMGAENDTFSPAFYFRWVEKAFCRRADWIAIPTEGAKDGYYPEFRDKLAVIPQGFKFDEYKYLQEIKPVEDGIPRFAFAGVFIQGRRDPRVLLQHLTKKEEPFEFHIFTKSPALVASYAARDKRIIVHEFTPRMTLLEKLAGMDFLINIENIGTKQTPSKLIDYWLCGRPILSVSSHNFEPAAVDRFLDGDYEEALTIEDPEQYDIGNISRRFLELGQRIEAE